MTRFGSKREGVATFSAPQRPVSKCYATHSKLQCHCLAEDEDEGEEEEAEAARLFCTANSDKQNKMVRSKSVLWML